MKTNTLANLSSSQLAILQPLVERVAEYAAEARSESTRRAYASQLRTYGAWCVTNGVAGLDARSVALYLTYRADAGASVSTLSQALAALSEAFQTAGAPSPRAVPVGRECWKGIRRKLGTKPKQAAPLMPEQLRQLSNALPNTLGGFEIGPCCWSGSRGRSVALS